jgi:hypothetical protein
MIVVVHDQHVAARSNCCLVLHLQEVQVDNTSSALTSAPGPSKHVFN